MKATFTALFVTLTLGFQAHAYLDVEEGALNARHFHMIKRGEDGEIVGRSFMNTYDIVGRDENGNLERRKCTTVNACGTPGGCMMMAAQRYCDGVPWQKSFQDAVKQTGANGVQGLKLMAEGIGRGPVGTIVGATKATVNALNDAKKNKKREFIDDAEILERRDFEVIERDEDMNLVERGLYSTFDLVTRDEDGFVTRACEMYNRDISCL